MSQQIVKYIDYSTAEGDTFDTIALSVYNEEKLSTNIITANPDYSDVLIFEAGVYLRIPVIANIETHDTLPPWRR